MHTFMGVAVRLGTSDPVAGEATPPLSWIVTPTTNCSAKFTYEQYATVNQQLQDVSTRGSLSTAYKCSAVNITEWGTQDIR